MSPNPTQSTGTGSVQDLTGKTLGNYVLIRRLGRGGMANVYLAQQTTLNRPVAVKVLKPELALDSAYVARFHREAQAAAALSQANIVQIIEIGEIEGIHFIAQEYVRGQNLRQYLNRNNVVEPILAVSIMRQVAAALQESSKQGVVHRDIKPENIMITSTGEVKVTDFGLARVLDDNRADLTQIGITMGTPLYMSPEQAEGSRVDTRSDLYSLGITAWHMMAGRPPFEGENALTIAVKHVKEEVPPLAKIRPDLPTELCEIIHKLIHKKPEDRIQNPAALIRQIRTLEFDDIEDWEQLTEKLAVRDDLPAGATMTTPDIQLDVTRQLETIMSGHFRPWWKSTWLIGTVAFMLVAGGVSGVLYSWFNPPPDPFAKTEFADGLVPRYPNADKQYQEALTAAWSGEASRSEQESLWKSVQEYFPEDVYRCRRAAVSLGAFYLDYNEDDDNRPQKLIRLEKARKVFEELARINDDRVFQITGIAGKAITLSEIQAETGDLSHETEVAYLLGLISEEDTGIIYNIYIRDRIEDLQNDHFPIRTTN